MIYRQAHAIVTSHGRELGVMLLYVPITVPTMVSVSVVRAVASLASQGLIALSRCAPGIAVRMGIVIRVCVYATKGGRVKIAVQILVPIIVPIMVTVVKEYVSVMLDGQHHLAHLTHVLTTVLSEEYAYKDCVAVMMDGLVVTVLKILVLIIVLVMESANQEHVYVMWDG